WHSNGKRKVAGPSLSRDPVRMAWVLGIGTPLAPGLRHRQFAESRFCESRFPIPGSYESRIPNPQSRLLVRISAPRTYRHAGEDEGAGEQHGHADGFAEKEPGPRGGEERNQIGCR